MDKFLTLQIDTKSETPALKQISDSLRIRLVNGDLPAGTEMPSVRRIALELGVHFNTLAEAYRILSAEGWLTVRHGRSCIVANRRMPKKVESGRLAEFRQRLQAVVAQMRSAGLSKAFVTNELTTPIEGFEKCDS